MLTTLPDLLMIVTVSVIVILVVCRALCAVLSNLCTCCRYWLCSFVQGPAICLSRLVSCVATIAVKMYPPSFQPPLADPRTMEPLPSRYTKRGGTILCPYNPAKDFLRLRRAEDVKVRRRRMGRESKRCGDLLSRLAWRGQRIRGNRAFDWRGVQRIPEAIRALMPGERGTGYRVTLFEVGRSEGCCGYCIGAVAPPHELAPMGQRQRIDSGPSPRQCPLLQVSVVAIASR